ncbi:hypothetical protein U9M48_010368 [Paspalum notatum var. saurae]|uniref:Uncharacterized protein n=1 Tax=Paspalum notatum var. saurae TaxID=547442 RepID=A0AAQ3WG28_PASNO
MASRLVAAAASSPYLLGRLISRRGFSGPPYGYWRPHEKVNLWEGPMNPMMRKTSHFMLASITVWGALVYGWFYLFGMVDQNAKLV